MNIEDAAQEHEAHIWAINNRARQVVTYQPGENGYGPEECESCGDHMPDVRRSYGFKTCTPCASAAERMRGRR